MFPQPESAARRKAHSDENTRSARGGTKRPTRKQAAVAVAVSGQLRAAPTVGLLSHHKR